ncbi:DNA-directed RNA polymerase III subunit RPC3 [Phymastichus coffea]|uniref:DNA-directed RNA polymerase III subunit RPC3 n=1 Tax=Phymastichus coffea TaxID=108790 RepID=UPI00273BA931|nr:DNA-directed RNA polymerase III subunit RPC3 [Phymastichus coffea]
MSLILKKLCKCILHEHFGPIVETVGDDLFKYGPRTLAQIKATTNLSVDKVKESLCVLIKFGLVMFEKIEKGSIIYTLDAEKVLVMLRYPKFMWFVKTNCGDEAEMMLEEVLKNGYETASKIIVKTYQRLEQFPPERRSTVPVLKEKFEELVKNQFLMRSICSNILSDISSDKPDFSIPALNIKALTRLTQGHEADAGDKSIYWKVNIDRFTQDLRDQILVNAITKRTDDNTGQLMRQLLYLMYLRTASWTDTSIPISVTEMKEAMKKNYPLMIPHLDQYLMIIEEDSSQFIQRVGDSGGGQYSVNMKEAFHQLAWAVLDNVVMERFGSKAARIFRLVRSHKYIEQEKIQQIAMIPAKETKHLTYTLLEEQYLQIQELKKSGVSAGGAPAKIFFLFHIDLNQVVRMTIEHCHHALYNIIQKRIHETSSNKRLIDKNLRMQTMISNFREQGVGEQQLKEIEEMMTPSEKQHLEQVQEVIKKLGSNEFCIDETLFLLQMYIRYHR